MRLAQGPDRWSSGGGGGGGGGEVPHPLHCPSSPSALLLPLRRLEWVGAEVPRLHGTELGAYRCTSGGGTGSAHHGSAPHSLQPGPQ